MLARRACVTAAVALHGTADGEHIDDPYMREYGVDAAAVREFGAKDASLNEAIDPELPYSFAQVLYAVRSEMARTLEDVLSRRTRALLLNADAAVRSAPRVAALMARELGLEASWSEGQVARFAALARADYSAVR
jgi:glycerol-3-phosphate dehydrogenase